MFGIGKKNKKGQGSPHSANIAIKENQAAETRKHIEDTVVELRAKSSLYSGKIQNGISRIRKIDAVEPVDLAERQRECRMLKMYLGQYRVVQAMRDNVETIYSEIEMRELTQDFCTAVNEITGLIAKYNKDQRVSENMFDSMRRAMEPISNETGLEKYDSMYGELMRMYPNNMANDPTGISDVWLEKLIAGEVSWDSVPQTEERAEPMYRGTFAQEEQPRMENDSEEDVLATMGEILKGLKGEK